MWRMHLLSLAIAATAIAVHAQPADPAPQVVVKYADLNINTPSGAQALVERLDRASRVACGGLTLDRFDLVRIEQFNSCRSEAMTHAVASINNPMVYAASHIPQSGALAQR